MSTLIGYTTNATTYAGSYRMIRNDATGSRYLQVRRAGAWVTIDRVIPHYIRGAYAAANWLGA